MNYCNKAPKINFAPKNQDLHKYALCVAGKNFTIKENIMTSQEKDVRSNSTLWTTRFLMYLLFLFTPTLVVVTEILLNLKNAVENSV